MCRFIDAEKATEGIPDGYSVPRAGHQPLHLLFVARRSGGVAERQRAEDELAEEIMRERDIRGVIRRRRRHLTVQDSKAAPASHLTSGPAAT